MIIYVEAVILDNFFLDSLLAYLTLSLVRARVRFFQVVLSALVGSGAALLMPLIGQHIPIKLLVLMVCTAIFSLPCSPRTYLVNTFVYTMLSFLLCGILSFLLGGRMQEGFIGVETGGAVGLSSLAVIILLYAVRQIKGLISRHKLRDRYAVAEIVGTEKSIRIHALFDSGNLLKDDEGKGVVVTDRRKIRSLGKLVTCGEMEVHTATGSKVLPLVKIPKIKIYSESGTNILTNVTAALSDLPKEYALILPCE